jgi:uncharacterized protein with LGFP repeats
VAVQVDGLLTTALEVVAGSEVVLGAPAASSYWRFQRWSDGGPRAHTVTMPDAPLSLRAVYRTAIDLKYAALHGRAGLLGAPRAAEHEVADGRSRTYAHGRILWSASTRAHEVHGPTLAKYLRSGGPAALGLPTTDTTAVRRGTFVHLDGGASIFASSRTGAHLLRGRIREAYAARGFQRSCLGFPRTDLVRISGGERVRFEHGRITARSGGRVVTRCWSS